MMNTEQNHAPIILVADDDTQTRKMLRAIMENEGYNVEDVGDGEQCLAAYTQLKPDIVLLDAMMPVMDGFMCCAQIQKLLKNESTPVLMITGLNDQASVDWAFEVGATDYITKPIQPSVLRQRVRRLIEASRAEKTLREREKQYRSVVESVKEVFFQIDATGHWIFLNSAWTTFTGFTVEESLGKNCLKFIDPDDQERYQQLWQSLVKGEKDSFKHEIRYVTKTGKCRWGEITIHSSLIIDGVVTGFSGMLQDTTELRKAQALEKEKIKLEADIQERERRSEIIRKSLEQEKELSELKSRVISTISHEFRTPMMMIQSSTELLAKYSEKLSDDKKLKHFKQIGWAVEHMNQLLTNVIFLDKTESGELDCHPEYLNLEKLCQKILNNLQLTLTSDYKIDFSSQSNSSQVNLDEQLVGQILTNILSNAVKYSPQGGIIKFEVFCQPEEAILTIRDSGIGIPPKEKQRVFESFYRATNVGAIKGTGLGLAIAKKCVELHRGKINLDSEIGVGTKFQVILPYLA
ncbi:response regulator [Moorena sp. SIO4G3]|uniref:hybrid sensor histidine kinase/response regulator n=1 Tax=Moorena sp. SIO4G3 TaxID=2607821 RepID=UPI00343AF17C